SVSANQPREPAVGVLCGGNANHGFFLPTPASLKDGQPHSIYAYAINIDAAGNPAGLNPLLVNSPKTIVPPDATPPTIAITSPTSSSTYSTSTTPLTLGGTASDNIGVIQVT